MRMIIAMLVLLLATAVGYSKDDKKTETTNKGKLGPIEYRKQETDTGRTVQKQYQVDVNKKNDVFIYGGSNTTYPAERYPGQDYHATNPSKQPNTSYGAGVGVRF